MNTYNELLDRYHNLIDILLDDRIATYGENNVIMFLLENNYSVDEIIDLCFDEERVVKAVNLTDDEIENFVLETV
jgi:hypothetical protein